MTAISHSKPTLTIFADASLYTDHGVVGWGGWARGDEREPVLHGGSAPFYRDSAIAELWALALFAERLVGEGYITPADKAVIVQSDSLSGLNMINAKVPNSWATKKKGQGSDILRAKKVKPEAAAAIDRLAKALSHADVIYLRHVKGHEGGKHARSWVNEQCDRRAKKEARAQIAVVAQ